MSAAIAHPHILQPPLNSGLVSQEILTHAGVAALFLEADGSISSCTDNTRHLLELDIDPLDIATVVDRIHPSERDAVRHWMRAESNVGHVALFALPSGRRLTGELKRRVVGHSTGLRHLLIITDCSEQVCRQAVQEHSSRLEDLGRLASGLAHDMNNILAVVIGNLSDIDPRDFKPEYDASAIESALEAGERGSRIVQSLARFGTSEIGPTTSLDLTAHIRQLLPVLRYMLGKQVALIDELGERRLPVVATQKTLDLAILEIIAFARGTMSSGGRLSISLSPGANSRRCVVLSFRDVSPDPVSVRLPTPQPVAVPLSGGIAPLPETTLARASHIIEGLGGSLETDVSVHGRSLVHITLPRARRSSGSKAAANTVVPAQSLRILVVDDEPPILRLARRGLLRSGHEVRVCSTPESALKCLEERLFDVLITDVVMPGTMGGLALATIAKADFPGVAVGIMSGHAPDLADTPPEWSVLRKPFTMTAIRDFVSDLVST